MAFEADTTQDILRRVFDPSTYKLKMQKRASSTGVKVKSATLHLASVAATTPYILVDLSDTTNYGHTNTNAVLVLGLAIHGIATSGTFKIQVGVIVENDATDGTARFFKSAFISSGVSAEFIDYDEGLDLGVTSGALDNAVTNAADANSVNWQNDVARVGPGGNANPAVGDVVVLVTVVSAGALEGDIEILYVTR